MKLANLHTHTALMQKWKCWEASLSALGILLYWLALSSRAERIILVPSTLFVNHMIKLLHLPWATRASVGLAWSSSLLNHCRLTSLFLSLGNLCFLSSLQTQCLGLLLDPLLTSLGAHFLLYNTLLTFVLFHSTDSAKTLYQVLLLYAEDLQDFII